MHFFFPVQVIICSRSSRNLYLVGTCMLDLRMGAPQALFFHPLAYVSLSYSFFLLILLLIPPSPLSSFSLMLPLSFPPLPPSFPFLLLHISTSTLQAVSLHSVLIESLTGSFLFCSSCVSLLSPSIYQDLRSQILTEIPDHLCVDTRGCFPIWQMRFKHTLFNFCTFVFLFTCLSSFLYLCQSPDANHLLILQYYSNTGSVCIQCSLHFYVCQDLLLLLCSKLNVRTTSRLEFSL